MIVHAGLIATLRDRVWRGVLIEGPSGIGKSDLALRMLSTGFRLVADDRVLLFKSAGRVFGRAPASIRGLIELRGLGVLPIDALRLVEISLVINCVAAGAVERLPLVGTSMVLEVEIPALAVCAFEASAPAKLCRALEVLGRARQQDYDAAFPQTPPRGTT
jgi:serine kinase of HPr protein (carbohydrate metabolism regulator)